MELIKCPVCSREVSSAAVSCPSCGHPLQNREGIVQTIQRTQKRWKAVKFVGISLLVIGGLLFINGMSNGSDVTWALGLTLGFVGLVTAVIGKLGAWWTTG